MDKNLNEDIGVKIPAILHFCKLGYEYQPIDKVKLGETTDNSTYIFLEKFKESLILINNKKFTDNEFENILSDINKSINKKDLGKEFHNWLINPGNKVKLIDFDTIDNNDFSIISELPYYGDCNEKSFRPDITILINGIPLSFLEVKKEYNPGAMEVEFNRITNDRISKEYFEKYFNMFQIISFSNNMKYEKIKWGSTQFTNGSFYATPNKSNIIYYRITNDEKFLKKHNFKDINEEIIAEIINNCKYDCNCIKSSNFKEKLKPETPCNEFITSIYDKERILCLIKNSIEYSEEDEKFKQMKEIPDFNEIISF